MHKKIFLVSVLIASAIVTILTPGSLRAQFNPGAAGTMLSQISTTDTSYYDKDSTVVSFSVKRYFRSLAHKDTMSLSNMFFGAMVLPGTGQIYNRDYWKVPVIYGAMGGCITGAAIYNGKWKKSGEQSDRQMRNILIWGAVATYWGQLADCTIRYKSKSDHLPARASIYSALLPGLGQAYNGDYWHIPLYYAGFMVSGYSWSFNQKQYKRYRNFYKQYAEGTYTGHLSEDNIVWFRDYYRRNRDYSILATTLIYVLNIIDANVFAHFTHFDISDDISLNVQRTILNSQSPSWGGAYTLNQDYSSNTFGIQMNLTF